MMQYQEACVEVQDVWQGVLLVAGLGRIFDSRSPTEMQVSTNGHV